MFLTILAATSAGGCSFVGPVMIGNGRSAYNEVINRTTSEEALQMIVRLRYGEMFGWLSVASVTANISVSARAGGELGVGPDRSYAGNLVPFSAGLAFEENPTISYVPHRGEDYARGLFSPLPIATIALLEQAIGRPDAMLRLAVRQINRLHNPLDGNPRRIVEFDRAVDLIGRLHDAGVVRMARGQDPSEGLEVIVYDYHPEHTADVAALMRLLGLPAPPDSGDDILLPARVAIWRRGSDAIDLEMRSLYEIIRLVGASIEIPPAHLESGIVEAWPNDLSETRRFVVIRSSRDRPDGAVVATQFHDWWYYIDQTDVKSKEYFLYLLALVGVHLEPDGATRSAPVLTIPVSK